MEKPKLQLKQPSEPTPEQIETAAAEASTSVYDILKEARQCERQKPLTFSKRENRKKRDYVVGTAIMNLILLVPVFVLPHNTMVLIATFSAVILCNIGFSWIMWVVISRY